MADAADSCVYVSTPPGALAAKASGTVFSALVRMGSDAQVGFLPEHLGLGVDNSVERSRWRKQHRRQLPPVRPPVPATPPVEALLGVVRQDRRHDRHRLLRHRRRREEVVEPAMPAESCRPHRAVMGLLRVY